MYIPTSFLYMAEVELPISCGDKEQGVSTDIDLVKRRVRRWE